MSDRIDLSDVWQKLSDALDALDSIAPTVADAALSPGYVDPTGVPDVLELALRVRRGADFTADRLTAVTLAKVEATAPDYRLLSPSGEVGWTVVHNGGRWGKATLHRIPDHQLKEAR